MNRYVVLVVFIFLTTVNIAKSADTFDLIGVIAEYPEIDSAPVPPKFGLKVGFIKGRKDWEVFSPRLHETAISSVVLDRWYLLDSTSPIQAVDDRPVELYDNDTWFWGRDKIFSLKGVTSEVLEKNVGSDIWHAWGDHYPKIPKVVTSRRSANEDKHWKKVSPKQKYLKQIRPLFRIAIGRTNLVNCQTDESDFERVDLDSQKVFLYEQFDGPDGRKLFAVGFDRSDYKCDGPSDDVWAKHWFLLDDGRFDLLGKEMTPLAFADLDNDGSTDGIFFHAGYNRNGFIMFLQDFRNRLDFLWGYH